MVDVGTIAKPVRVVRTELYPLLTQLAVRDVSARARQQPEKPPRIASGVVRGWRWQAIHREAG